MSVFVIGDIHGGLKALQQLLERLQLSKEDQLIFLGDYVDGWSESAQVIQYLIELSETNECVFIKGNHDVWCEDWLRTRQGEPVWLAHGGKETIDSYEGFSEDKKKQHLYFFEDMPLYHIDDYNRLFIHAGFTSIRGVDYEKNKTNCYFDRTLWEMALTLDKRIQKTPALYPNRLKQYYEIYIGHTPTIRYNNEEPMNAINVWNVDTGAAFTGKLSAIDIETKAIFQSDVLLDLYPNELGRNKR
ncbi:metallophosphoesterase [uncultured Psychroserpens sp.]|uniref:metallophosphoesterase n=1 Tax=uncultured Psychroserpens sp. TaxID=255436 RepID=UPI00262DCA4F|nr:metallophosphoesterase [uncultured Psychroserpens sp.]